MSVSEKNYKSCNKSFALLILEKVNMIKISLKSLQLLIHCKKGNKQFSFYRQVIIKKRMSFQIFLLQLLLLVRRGQSRCIMRVPVLLYLRHTVKGLSLNAKFGNQVKKTNFTRRLWLITHYLTQIQSQRPQFWALNPTGRSLLQANESKKISKQSFSGIEGKKLMEVSYWIREYA